MCVVTSEREAGNLEFSIKIKSVHFECRKRGTLYTNNIKFYDATFLYQLFS